MIWHWIIFFVLALGVFIEQFTSISSKYCIRICAFLSVVCIFISSIRWNQTVCDWSGYYTIFSRISLNSFSDIFKINYWPFEPIYYLTIRIIKFLTNNFVIVELYMALIGIGLYYKGAKYNMSPRWIDGKMVGSDKSLIIASYFVFWATSFCNIYTVRTNMAAAICLYSVRYIEERKLKQFLVTVLIATGFHFSAPVFLIAYFIYNKKINIKMILVLLFVLLIVEIVGIESIFNLIALLGGRYAEKVLRYNYYRGQEDFSYLLYSTGFLMVRALANSILVVGIGLFVKRKVKDDERYNGMLNLYMAGVVIQALTISYNMELSRIAIYFQVFQAFTLPYVFKVFKQNVFTKLICYCGFIVYMMVKMYSLYNRELGFQTFNTIFS